MQPRPDHGEKSYRGSGRLQGRKALITGGDSGIGRAVALAFAREGADVAIAYLPEEEEDARETVHAVEQAKRRALAIPGDIRDPAHCQALATRVARELGGLDLLVNNAGIEKQVPLLELSLADWEAVLRTNLTGAFLCLREAGKLMAAAGGGTIVNMSSVHEFIPWPGFAHYCASKGGMKLLMQTAARELAPHKIRLVNIAPGAIVTPINQFVLDDPEEIAAAVAWAASDEASYVTGTTIVVDGGMSLYPNFV
jgi:NAD(P)-dependent dehydrogenase (short-subunit alcohol dehydrogenase family)